MQLRAQSAPSEFVLVSYDRCAMARRCSAKHFYTVPPPLLTRAYTFGGIAHFRHCFSQHTYVIVIVSHLISTAVLLDTKGPEIRSGFFADGAKSITLVKGETLTLTTDYAFKGDAKKLACSYPSLPKSVNPGQKILVADGSLVLTVLSCDEAAGEVETRIDNNAKIGERKNCLLYTSPSPRDRQKSRMPSSA